MTVSEILDNLRKTCGDDWAEKLAREMTTEERDTLREALERKDDQDSA